MRRHGWAAIPAWLGRVKGCSCLSVRDPGPLLTAGAWAVVSHSAGAALLSGQGTWQSVCLSIYPSGHATWRGGGTEVLPCWLLLQGGLWHLSLSQRAVLGPGSRKQHSPACVQAAGDGSGACQQDDRGFRACSVASLSQGTRGSSFRLWLCFGAGLQQEIAAAVFQRCMT